MHLHAVPAAVGDHDRRYSLLYRALKRWRVNSSELSFRKLRISLIFTAGRAAIAHVMFRRGQDRCWII